jgi:hypothetical protein
MLFNDSGFVRFRLGNDHPSALAGGGGQPTNEEAAAAALRQSYQDLVANSRGVDGGAAAPMSGSHQQLLLLQQQRESFKGSRSFDEGILSDIRKACPETNSRASPLERPQSNLSYVFAGRISGGGGADRQIKSELCSPDVEGLPGLPQRPASKLATHSNNSNSSSNNNNNGRGGRLAAPAESDTDAGEQYEAPAGMVLPETTRSLAAQVRSAIGTVPGNVPCQLRKLCICFLCEREFGKGSVG